jgi:hypothetical protein
MRANGGGTGTDVAVAGCATVAGAAGIYGATTTSHTGPIIAGVVAIFVALVTWYATDRRQSKALAAERQRFDRQLQAENERLRETLAHQQESRELEELRAVLDNATETLTAANIKTSSAVWNWRQLPFDPTSDRKSAVVASSGEAYDALMAAMASWYRVTLRLGDEHPVALTLRKAIDAIQELGRVTGLPEPTSDQQLDRLAGLEKARIERLGDFRTAAVKAVGSRL